jgi:SAM-dependent methyltransferase
VIAPVFDHVIAIDRSDAQLDLARARIEMRGYTNTHLVRADLDDADLRKRVKAKGGADVVFAIRVLHHAPRPADVLMHLAELCRAPSTKKGEPGGVVIVVDYACHEDESMRAQADLWLGFEGVELRRFARRAGLEPKHVGGIVPPGVGNGPDGHLPWQVMVAERTSDVRARSASKS